jgi:hypothetical protein
MCCQITNQGRRKHQESEGGGGRKFLSGFARYKVPVVLARMAWLMTNRL